MKNKVRSIIFLVVLYLGFLLITLPAEQAYALAKTYIATDAPVIMEGVTGTIWNGKANTAYIAGQRIKALSWSMQPWGLFLGRLQTGFDFRDGENFAHGNIAQGIGGRTYLSDLQANIALQKITAAAKLPLGLQGSVGLNLERLEIENNLPVDVAGTVAWQGAEINFPSKYTIGDLKATLATQNGIIKASIIDGGGPLQADGLLTLNPDGKYKFTGTFSSRDNKQPALKQGLQLLGRAGSDGKTKVNKSGSLADFSKLF